MIIPMLLKIDFGALHQVRRTGAASASRCSSTGRSSRSRWRCSAGSSCATCSPRTCRPRIDSYIAGLILLAAAPCTAMVFVWSRSPTAIRISRSPGRAERRDHDRSPSRRSSAAAGPVVDRRALGHAVHLGRPLHRHPGDRRAGLARSACCGGGEAPSIAALAAHRPVVHRGAARHARAAVRLPGRRQILEQPLVIAMLAVPILIQVFFNSALAYWLNRRPGRVATASPVPRR